MYPLVRRALVALVSIAVLAAHLALTTTTPAAAAETRDPALWPFASTSPWNMPIGSGARFSNDWDPRIQTLRSAGSRVNANEGYSHPIVQARTSDPWTSFTDVSYSHRSRAGHTPTWAMPASGTDGHLHVISPDKRTVIETWVATRHTNTSITALRVEQNDLYGSGILDGGTRAYGGSAIGGLVRTHELNAGTVPHAVAVAMNPDQLVQPSVWPANADDGWYPGGGTIPMGTLFAIPGHINVENLGLNREALMIARAMQNYGAYVVDQGAPFVVYVEQGASQSHVTNIDNQLETIKNLLQVVTNNGPNSVGGGGTPRVPLAPPLNGEPSTDTYTPPAAPTGTAPGAPTSVAATAIKDGMTTPSWAPPASDGGNAVTGYRVSRDGTDTGGYGAWSTVVDAGTRSLTFHGMRATDTYTLTVEAINDAGTGPAVSTTTGAGFSDDDGDVHEPNIEHIVSLGITNGCSPTNGRLYCPYTSVTRAQMATFLVRAAGLPATSTDHFSDDAGDVHQDNINRAASAGLMTGWASDGCGVGRFCPTKPVTRAEMATMVARAFRLPAVATSSFTDLGSTGVHAPAIESLAGAGVVRGCKAGHYCPTGVTTRAAMATIISNAIRLP